MTPTTGPTTVQLYLATILIAAVASGALTPLVRRLALSLGWMDAPATEIKTHKVSTPSLGGIAIFLGFALSLVVMRFITDFPTGTLFSLRAVLTGAAVVFALGVVDDLRKPQGLGFKSKFAGQILAACLLVYFDIRIRFITPDYLAVALTVLWVVGITNAFNIIDIMDGLCASQAVVAALGFLLIALPSEQVYVNFASAALLGGALGFLPWNLSDDNKIFMGDSGSMVIGFVLAALSLGTDYSKINPLGVYAPLFILLVPIYDTFFVMALRMMKGHSTFLGSKDHFALRLEAMGFTRPQVVAMAVWAAALLSLCAFLVTRVRLGWAVWIYAVVFLEIGLLSWRISRVEMR